MIGALDLYYLGLLRSIPSEVEANGHNSLLNNARCHPITEHVVVIN